MRKTISKSTKLSKLGVYNHSFHFSPVNNFSTHNLRTYIYSTLTGLAALTVVTLALSFANSTTLPTFAEEVSTDIATAGAYYLNLTASDTVALSVDSPSVDSTIASVSDTVTVKTNSGSGYQLYLSMASGATSNALTYNTTVNGTPRTYELPATTAVDALSNDSWGYSTDNTTWKAVPVNANNLTSSDVIKTTNAANEVGDTTTIYYGAKVTSATVPGTYTGTVMYSALGDAAAQAEVTTATTSPSSFIYENLEDKTLTITTPLFTNMTIDPNKVSVIFNDENTTVCPVTSLTSPDGQLVVSCILPSLAVDAYTVTVNITDFGKTYTSLVEYKPEPNTTLIADNTISSPSFNVNNFTTLDTTGTGASTAQPTRSYYFGQYGNAFYGSQNQIDNQYWELVDQDGKINDVELYSQWNTSDAKGCVALSNVNGWTNTYFNNADQTAMKKRDISTDTMAVTVDGYYWQNTSSYYTATTVTGATLWPLSAGQYIQSGWIENGRTSGGRYGTDLPANGLAIKTSANIGSPVLTRSFSGYDTYDHHYKNWYFIRMGRAGYVTGYISVNYSFRVAPAFNLDLTQVLLSKNDTASQSSSSISNYIKPFSDMKFLINAGSTKSSMEITAINNTSLPTTQRSETYSLSYNNASNATINSGTNYLSVIFYDENGLIKYYGNLGSITSGTGTIDFTIPDSIESGTYTVAIFEEEKTDAYKTDYASTPVYMLLVKD